MGKARSRAIFTLLTDLFTNRQGICWVMVERTSGQVIGTCEFHNFDSAGGRTDIGCEQLPEYQKQGYMTEALTELLDYAFNTLGLVELVARIHPENIASVALFSRLGFEEAKGVQAGGFLRLVARGDTGMDDYGWL